MTFHRRSSSGWDRRPRATVMFAWPDILLATGTMLVVDAIDNLSWDFKR